MHIPRFVRCFALALLILAMAGSSFGGVVVSVTIAPPVLPVYSQPPCPGDGYIWTPGYWAYGPDGYYWVPGTWVMPPAVGLLWTPGYWGWGEGVYIWHAGYWGPHIGFYGGVNYGFGYFGTGYAGGYWRGRTFYYNRRVNNVRITNVHIYNRTVINKVTVKRVSYHGGPGGINARATRAQEMAFREHHFEPTRMQLQHEHGAASNRAFLASENHGRPSVAATARPGEFHGRGVVTAHSGRPLNRPAKNTPVSRAPKSTRNTERPMARQETRGNRVARPDHSSPRGDRSPRPTSYSRGDARPHEHAPQQGKTSHSGGNGHRPH